MKKILVAAGITAISGVSSVFAINGVSALTSNGDKDATNKTSSSAVVEHSAAEDQARADKMAYATAHPDEVGKQGDATGAIKEDHGKAGSDESEAEVKQQRQAFLDQAVAAGKITQAQATELQAQMDKLMPQVIKPQFEGKTDAERDAIVKAAVDAFNQWAQSQHISSDVLPVVQFHDNTSGKGVLSIEEKF